MFTSRFLSKFATVLTILIMTMSTVQPALAAPPLNDFFADAQVIDSFPLNATVDISEASAEFNEPSGCWGMDRTVWYSITPAETMTVRADTFGSVVNANINVYRSNGFGIGNMSFLGCAYFSNSPVFLLQAGETYYFQAGAIFGEIGSIQVNVEEYLPPAPLVSFGYNPSDPSPYDAINFCDNSNDIGGFGFNAYSWDFGDGPINTNVNCVTHQYAADGDYTVYHEATTIDGRTASTSQVVQVRTHDVWISRISAPQSANSGQTRAVTVYVKNKSYAETVRIELYRSTPAGLQLIGSYMQFVPARSTNRTVAFTFNYTFTPSDASIGKVSFKAIAVIEGARDALPADNEAISSPPTKVSR